jgi:hypothetical protein
MTKWWLPQAWSVPSPLVVNEREKSDAVKVVTLARLSAPPTLDSAPSKYESACATLASRFGWVVFWKSWVSQPPRLTKNTCRFTPSVLEAAIIRATVCS